MSRLACGTLEEALWELAEGTSASARPESLDHVEKCSVCQERLAEMRRLCSGLESLATADASRLPESIGPYKPLLELGRGGQGVVYLAEDPRLRRKVALKALARLGPEMKESINRLRREAAIASKLDHPGICTIHDAGVEGDLPYIVMRYVEGETLAQRLQSAPGGTGDVPSSFIRLDSLAIKGSEAPTEAVNENGSSTTSMTRDELAAILTLIGKVARALHVAHEAGIIHRDVKPANIMIDKEGEPVVLDFGLARLEDDGGLGPTMTRTGDLFGTPAYMSPEQLTARRIPLDRCTDIWSLGVTLYECLTLQRPFEAPTRHGLYQAILSREPTDPGKLNPGIPTDLKVVLETALQKDRDRRYHTALALAEDLDHVQRHEPIVARPVGPVMRTWLWARRNPAVASLLAAVFILLATGLAWTAIKNRQLDSLRIEAESNLAKVTRLADQRQLEQLRGELTGLGPSTPENENRLAVWVAASRKLLSRLAQHRTALETLRQRARPYTESDRLRDHRGYLEQIENLRERQRVLRRNWGNDIRPRIELGETESQLRKLEAKVADRLWSFDHREDAWRHQVLARLCEDLEQFAQKDVPSVEQRLALARLAPKLIEEDDSLEWLVDIDGVARNPVYGGLELRPQLGLLPLGPDPDSGLHEYLHLETHEGPIPERDLRGRLTINDSTGLILVLVPGGSFQVGAGRGRSREVTLKAFFISKFEMSIGQWSRATGEPPEAGYTRKTYVRPLLAPRSYVSWNDCREVLDRLNLALPLEAQWEYAARAGTSTPWWTGATPETLEGAANVADQRSAIPQTLPTVNRMADVDDGYMLAAPVSSLKANPFGLHHVHGNVFEWCRTEGILWSSYHRVQPDGSFKNPGPPVAKAIIRGGSFRNLVNRCRSAARDEAMLTDRHPELGVRPAREIVHRPLPAWAPPRTAQRSGVIDWLELQAVLSEEEGLWPALPEKVPEMETWFARAQRLAGRIARSHSALLETPVDVDEVDSPELRSLRDEEASLKETLGSSEPLPIRKLGISRVTPPQREVLRRRLERELKGISRRLRKLSLHDALLSGQTFAHAGERRAFSRRLRAAQALPALRGAIESVQGRLETASSLLRKSIKDHEKAWAQAARDIAESPHYGGVTLEPLLGFVPLGEDPDSGLWEFAHVTSGSIPERDSTSGKLRIDEDTGLVFVLIPGGKFLMGAQKKDPEGPNYDPQGAEEPVNAVTLDAFLLSKYEMTQAQWLRVAEDNPSSFAPGCRLAPVSGLHPVETIAADEAKRMLGRLGLQLPTEAQWEYACRAGTTTPWWTGSDAASILGKANLGDRAAHEVGFGRPKEDVQDGFAVHAPVASFVANPYGLHDMNGNVGEICGERITGMGNSYLWPVDEGTGRRRCWGGYPARRGGDFQQGPEAARSAWRDFVQTEYRHLEPSVERPAPSIGIRPSLDLPRR